MAERIVISVGGSLIVPDTINADFLSRFRSCISTHVSAGRKFFLIAGGGKTARRYQEAGRAVHGDLARDDVDWLGIHATRLNGHLLRTIFREEAHPRMEKDPTRVTNSDYPVMVGAGWKPGWSTDYCAVAVAKQLGAKRLVNLSDIDFVYDRDPRAYADAKPIGRIGWSDFRKLLPPSWDPGLSAPFDPVAAKEAESLGMEVAVIQGSALSELGNYLEGKAFRGTLIT